MQQDAIVQNSEDPDSSQIWLPCHHALDPVCIACNYCYFQHPEESLSEIGSAVTVHLSSPSPTSFLPQWRVLIFVEIQWQLQTG